MGLFPYILKNMTKWLDLAFSTEILEENLFLSQNLSFSSLQDYPQNGKIYFQVMSDKGRVSEIYERPDN